MLEMHEQDPYFEMIAQRHEARLILTDEVKSPLKRDYLKYQKECRVQIEKTYRCER